MTSFTIDGVSTTTESLALGEIGAVLPDGAIVTDGNSVDIDDASLFVSGLIMTNSAAVVGLGDVTLVNASSGSLIGEWAVLQLGGPASLYTITNEGLMQGANNAILIEDAGGMALNNTGTITGTVFNAVQINSAGHVEIVNDGQISGMVAGILVAGTATVNITNSGVITGDSAIFSAGSGAMTVVNTGTLIGNVALSTSADVFNGRTGDQSQSFVDGAAGADTLTGSSLYDAFLGGDDNDRIRTQGGNDDAFGGAGDDNIRGGNGDDYLQGDSENDDIGGGRGSDELHGGTGDDRLNGGYGNDFLDGEDGADLFVFSLRSGDDVVAAFEDGIDQIDLSAFGFADVSEVLALAETQTNGLSIDLSSVGGGSILISSGLTLAQLDASDLIL